jgi:hypothetical protein
LGNFRFTHIKPGTYALYALKDESGTYEYTSKAQIFAFADSPVNLAKSTAPLLLYAYEDTSGTIRPKKNLLPTPVKKEEKDKVKRLILSANLQSGLLDLHKQFELSFATPIKGYDSTKMRFTTDSFQNITHFIIADSLKKKLTVFYNWKENTLYHLILEKDFAEDTLGEKLLKTDTISFTTRKQSDYGNLRLRFRNLDLSLHPVLLVVQDNKVFLSYPINRSLRYNNKLLPG